MFSHIFLWRNFQILEEFTWTVILASQDRPLNLLIHNVQNVFVRSDFEEAFLSPTRSLI